ncbi:fimbrial chaperone protein/chaperone protein EcpD [Serratia fonticola]|uniref:Fimbrial chaperone protein/chaperone protein EcpD n=1 Tax=Serratia fonticola TaxID=47917 RepID=A0A542BSH9_SERFO|nr:fimbria/pilus periplasmic chaperone [Serratia fonticola]TQI81514.1 fimbrial chaperone protein/chaperone protein EcpD [Serratia fonticola]TQI96462.1 fimbrial chaperone protein/chaperone protein EcpD [Serratia fonticola]TVZ70959.1 fimbrial chaperone protein/chaperone protein EcpD [Serratia fonticola]
MAAFNRSSLTVKPWWLSAVMLAVLFAFLILLPAVHAEIYLGTTRLIVNAQDKEATLRVSNEGQAPVLLQIWLDTGDSEAAPEKIATPFTVAPPILRLDGKRSQRLRVLFTGRGTPLPADRESVFWLNVLEIPQKVTSKTASQVQMAFRTRIKLFYRPQALLGISTTHIQEQLRFRLVKQASGPVVMVSNPTPFHQTLLEISLGRDKNQLVATLTPENGMVAPRGQADFALKQTKGMVGAGMKVFYSVLDDFGSVVMAEQTLQP